jgi:antitoxin ParD1/3/4
MEVRLPPEQEAFIEQNVRTGRFASSDEAIHAAIELLEEQERELDELKAAVDEADEDIAQGRYTDYADEALPQLLEELKHEGKALRHKHPGSPR